MINSENFSQNKQVSFLNFGHSLVQFHSFEVQRKSRIEGLYIDHISGCNNVIKAYPNFSGGGGGKLVSRMDTYTPCTCTFIDSQVSNFYGLPELHVD